MNEQIIYKKHKPLLFESDAEKVVHRHLANKDDIITEDDIRNIRIGSTPASNNSEHPEKTSDHSAQGDSESI